MSEGLIMYSKLCANPSVSLLTQTRNCYSYPRVSKAMFIIPKGVHVFAPSLFLLTEGKQCGSFWSAETPL